ncbi:YihY/virulence factor BrkB family protein [Paraburkholderia megapolitana]|uniref:Membrane protein n=1 Tax=Paraburkholderia megapolitana TaxID=420953 RepID=A0A1I3EQC7_9BURK|nr:YihY/virulence factor BrkB family protein [Paraburkholderia megapolitana]QDQ80210.1 YihY/virulence factor BrkB family protein [Paraburkholderia megapolitana]SFI01050.1 membrane protein [Paraburkholderia megapolitana]
MDTLSSEKLQTVARKQASWAIGALRQFSANRCAAMAAGIAFYAAFSLAPTLVMVIAIAGWFFGAEAARGELFREVHGVLGNEAAAGITTIVENAHRSGNAGGIAAIISFAALAIGASATFSSLNSALNMVWPPVGTRSSSVVALVRVRLISFSLVLGVAFLLIVSLVLDTAITFVGQWLWGNSPYVVIGNVLQLIVGLLVLAFAFAALLKFLPDAVVRWQDAMVGGLVAAVLFSAGKKLFALYLAHAGMANSFGAAGSLAVLLMWLYFSAAVLLLGAEFSAARGRLHDPRGAWGLQDSEPPPGSRAKLASVIAASTVAAGAQRRRDLQDSLTADPASALSLPQVADTDADAPPETPATNGAVRFGRTVVRVENQATRAAAATLVQAGRGAVAADRYVKRHPWGSLLLAAGAALVVTAVAGRRNGDSEPPAAANDDR